MLSDEALMIAYVRGDLAAFDELYHRYAPVVRRVLRSQLVSHNDTEDLLQQTFLQVHRARRDFDPTKALRPWLFTIAMNLKRQLARGRRRRPESFLDAEGHELEGSQDAIARADARQDLAPALARLAPDQLEVITLHWFGGLAFPEVALLVGASTAAVKVRAHRGYATLRQFLESHSITPRDLSSNCDAAAGISSMLASMRD